MIGTLTGDDAVEELLLCVEGEEEERGAASTDPIRKVKIDRSDKGEWTIPSLLVSMYSDR